MSGNPGRLVRRASVYAFPHCMLPPSPNFLSPALPLSLFLSFFLFLLPSCNRTLERTYAWVPLFPLSLTPDRHQRWCLEFPLLGSFWKAEKRTVQRNKKSKSASSGENLFPPYFASFFISSFRSFEVPRLICSRTSKSASGKGRKSPEKGEQSAIKRNNHESFSLSLF